jgi:ABC-type sulfate transport system permease component
MASPKPPPAYYRKVGPTFQPRFSLGILYLFAFFFLYCLFLIAPSLMAVLETVPTGPEQQQAAEDVAREVIQPRLWIAVVLSAVTTVAGAHFHLLPGFREVR